MMRWKKIDTTAVCRRGMTMVELMVSLVIFAVVIGVVFGFLTESRRSYSSTRQRAQYQQGVRAVMSLVTREVRSAGADPSPLSPGFERIPVAGANTLRCRMDLNGDRDTDDLNPDEDVTYTYDPDTDTLSRQVGAGAAVVVLRELTSFGFNYYDNDGDLLVNVPLNATDRAEVAAIDLVIGGETDDHQTVNYTTRIAVRNN